ncbi:acetylornithine deacetylase [Aestuariirhabdus litorea]|uniref:Acetylornithine deacetylase n=1 Tax=Aestuariirhabdus litorea TaxID=2528527 RepID=A0A3P3VI22_9GAMM|nr:acetylornithine deacetylase [Aestuariirhabdus litorea]RRJ82375.1 acetylornithine deacetylase [Aestuariirhabdus litorea]RWW92538.1 acetylornithine deacetylase [Endozoicomonadaceae bacterium GTF-13]
MPTTKLPPLLPLLARLIELPSISCTNPRLDQGNRALIDQLAQWFESLGFTIDIQPLPNQPHKANLIATLGSGPGGLVLAGHTDTVPCDESLWSSNPFSLAERDQRLYGLGVCDMKGFFPLVIEAIRELPLNRLQQPLVILATADEESSMAGARALAKAGKPKGRFALIGEPTGMRPVHMHKGIMMERIHIQGQSGHSSNPSLGRNAAESMQRVMAELMRFRAELQQQYHNELFEVPVPTLNLGCLHGGDNPNRICGQCTLEYDLRPLPGMQPAELREMIRQRLQPIAAADQVSIRVEPIFDSIMPFATATSSELVTACEQLTGYSAEAVAFATEAPFLSSLGMDTLVLGPGDIDQAHQPDEFLALERINPMVDLIRSLIRRFCLQP